MTKTISDAERALIKIEWQALVDAVGGADIAARAIGRSAQYVSRLAQMHEDDLPPLACVMRLERAAGSPLVSSAMVASVRDAFGGQGFSPRCAADLIAEACKTVAQTSDAMADGALTPAEADALAAQLSDLGRKVSAAKRKLAAARASGGAGAHVARSMPGLPGMRGESAIAPASKAEAR